MDEAPPFDLHAAESAAQSAAIWLVLEMIVRQQLRHASPAEHSKFLDSLVETAETIMLPRGQQVALEWIARRYWCLVDNFAARCRHI